MTFIFDLDDTICTTDVSSEQYIIDFIIKNNLPYKLAHPEERYTKQKFNWDDETSQTWYKQHGDHMILSFPCKPNAVKVINMLHEQGHRIVFATARSTDWYSQPKETTIAWLKKNDIKYDKLYTATSDKERICELENADFFLDDDVEITKRVAAYFSSVNKGKAFLMESKYNKDIQIPENIQRVKDLKEFISFLNEKSLEIQID